MTIRVQIPAYADMWMRGDRYGELIKTSKRKSVWRFGTTPSSKKLTAADQASLIGHVKLDKSGKTIKVLLDDCEWLS